MGEHPKVLVVDDDPQSAMNVEFLLKKQGFDVIVASSAEETSRVLEKILPDIILLDVVLPDIPGTEFCKALKQDNRYSHLPVVLISGLRISDEDKRAGFALGAVDYLTRPFNITDLVTSLRKALTKTRDLEDEAASDREMNALLNLSKRETRETSILFDSAPLKIQYPESYQIAVKEYENLLDNAINERFFKVEQHLHEKLSHMCDTLGFLKVSAKDLIDIHSQSITARINGTNLKAGKIILEESRYLLIELMGNMINYYRRKSI